MSKTPDDLVKISGGIAALRDHFDSEGKIFMVAMYYKDGRDEEKAFLNLISTSAKDFDYLMATASWTQRAMEYIDEEDDTSKYKKI